MFIKKGHRCKGCDFDDNTYSNICVISEAGKTKLCPCTTCVVNVMCKNTCESYRELKKEADNQLYNWRR